MIPRIYKGKLKRIFPLFFISLLVVNLAGCEALVKKFTRKSKRTEEVQMVLAPEEYKPTLSKEELYRQYLMFWKSWQSELVESLLQNKSLKKRVDCANEAIKNLENMKRMLIPEKQKKLDVYIERMGLLKDRIASDINGMNNNTNRERAESLQMSIWKDFSFNDIKNFLL
ncbi:MAG: hypothetical protein FJZ09_00290 [Candidatus Omnitrophica bacterium]|nr:hypothetical protein [Candidatus Omnitrophota bacterium]